MISFVLIDAGSPATVRGGQVTQDNWSILFANTDGDGTSIANAYFLGSKVFAKLTLPFIFVNYSDPMSCCTDNLGNAVRKSGATKSDFAGGFQIYAVYCFGSCKPYDSTDGFSYKYIERYYFYATGYWRAQLDLYGPGVCGTCNSTYEVFWRVDYDINDAADDHFWQYVSGTWVQKTTEATYPDNGVHDANGHEWRQSDDSPSRRYYVGPLTPTTINYNDLAVVYHGVEMGGSGLKEYPTEYDNNESIANADIVQWYWGYVQYHRPAGCQSTGVGCTTVFTSSFHAADSGY